MSVEPRARTVEIPVAGGRLRGDLEVPRIAAVVVFAHGGGSSRLSPRNQAIARALRESGVATLLPDTLMEGEAQDQKKLYDIELQADRILAVADWLARRPETRDLRLGLFGSGSGAAAALRAASWRPQAIGAVVGRGGWLDLAQHDLPRVKAPTLLIVGALDADILAMNRLALEQLPGPKELVVIPGASHLFPEPGTLDEVARLTTRWFTRHLVGSQPAADPGAS